MKHRSTNTESGCLCMRVSDTLKIARSFTIFRKQDGGLIVKPSHWAPGYTAAHCETPQAAIEKALQERSEAIQRLFIECTHLQSMLESVKSEGD